MNNMLAATKTATPATRHSKASVKYGAGLETVSIERLLIWAYRDQMVGHTEYWGGDAEERWQKGGTASNVVAVMRALELMAIIHGTATVGLEAEPHADALAVHQAVLTLDPPGRRHPVLAETVMRHAMVGTQPGGWHGPVIEMRGLMKEVAGGDPVRVFLDKRGNHVRASHAWYCPLRMLDHADQLSAARGRWRVWRGALGRLAGHFRSQPHALKRWSVSESLPIEAPWLD